MNERLLFEAFLFALVGLGLEVVETALLDLPSAKDRSLMGHSSVWYLPFYAVLPIAYFEAFHEMLFQWPFYARGVVYMLSFWTMEYLAMGLLRLALGKSPSQDTYLKSRWNIHGLIRLDLGPVWTLFGFVFEWMYRSLRHL